MPTQPLDYSQLESTASSSRGGVEPSRAPSRYAATRSLNYAIEANTEAQAQAAAAAHDESFADFLGRIEQAPTPASPAPAADAPPPPLAPRTAVLKRPEPSPERFVREYILCGNDAVEAAKRAGYATPWVDGPRLMKSSPIRIALQHLKGAALELADLTRERVTLEITRVALFDPAGLYHTDGTLKKPHELTDDQRAALSQIKAGPYGVDYKFHDKLKALQQAMDILQIGQKTTNLNIKGDITTRVNIDTLSPDAVDRMLGIAAEMAADLGEEVIDVEP